MKWSSSSFFLVTLSVVVCFGITTHSQPLHLSTFAEVEAYFSSVKPAFPLPNIGASSLSITHSKSQTQVWFSQAISCLHTFWPYEALRALFAAKNLEPQNAMVWWGLYKALEWNNGYKVAAQTALATAVSLSSGVSEREQLYIESQRQMNISGWEAYNTTMQELFAKFPLEKEGMAFWAWNLVDATVNTFGNPLPGRSQAQQMLFSLIAKYPTMVAANHYLIHAYEDTFTPWRALAAANKIVSLAPAAGHLTHMVCHVVLRTFAHIHTLIHIHTSTHTQKHTYIHQYMHIYITHIRTHAYSHTHIQ